MRSFFKRLVFALLVFVLVHPHALAHPSAKLHFNDMSAVFGGYGDDANFKDLVAVISGGIDNQLCHSFTNSVGKIPGNHRILGHGWTLNAAIPKETLDKLLKANPDRTKDDIIKVWSAFARYCIAKSEELTGLPKKQANALASMIYDIHLLGDLEPDNTLIKDVLALGEIVKNFKKDADELFADKPEYSALVVIKLEESMKLNLPMQQKAAVVMGSLYELRLGTMLHSTWNKTLRMTYSPDANIKARQRASERRQVAETNKDTAGTPEISSASKAPKSYSRSSTGTVHNSGCRHFKAGQNVSTVKPTDTNCKKCGGFSK